MISRNALDCIAAQAGMTLIELTVVLLVLIALAGVVVPYVGSAGDRTACQTTDATLGAVRDAIMGGGAGAGYLADMGDLPYYLEDPNGAKVRHDSLHFLFVNSVTVIENNVSKTYYPNAISSSTDSRLYFNPNTGRGWRGPYLQGGITLNATTGEMGVPDQYPNNRADLIAIALQAGETSSARLVSAGPDGVVNTSTGATQDDLKTRSNDDRVLFLRVPDPGHNQPCSDQ